MSGVAQPQVALQTLSGQASVGSEVGTEWILLRPWRYAALCR